MMKMDFKKIIANRLYYYKIKNDIKSERAMRIILRHIAHETDIEYILAEEMIDMFENEIMEMVMENEREREIDKYTKGDL